jgi:hypothetical protein
VKGDIGTDRRLRETELRMVTVENEADKGAVVAKCEQR